MIAALDQDTIAAIATAPGKGGIGIVRLSGKNALMIAEKITQKKLAPRFAFFTGFFFHDGALIDSSLSLIDSGIALFFPSPKSFTGEDVVELQAHGSPIVLNQLLQRVLQCGARQARPGEFSERAFLNNKIDLTQAEAIADLISASSAAAARSAVHSLQGAFSAEINTLIEKLIALRVYIEAAMDFPDEEVDFLSAGKIEGRVLELKNQLAIIFSSAQQGRLLTEGMTLVIAGKPNAGKSSLLNALAQRDAAIVTPIAGTTRDILREHIQIDGMPLHIIDTAGLRESVDLIEQEGIRRAQQEIEKADRLLLVVDSSDSCFDDAWPSQILPLPKNIPVTLIKNKNDLSGLATGIDGSTITLSAKTGDGVNLLKQHLKQVMGFSNEPSGIFSARLRHVSALQEANNHIESALQQLLSQKNSELLAEELRLAQQALEAITGRFTADDLLDKIFRDFCIGK